MPEMVNHPAHYNEHPSGVECIEVIRPLCFSLGSAIKYFWRCSLKGSEEQDIEKAIWYLKDLKDHLIGVDPIMMCMDQYWYEDCLRLVYNFYQGKTLTSKHDFAEESLQRLIMTIYHKWVKYKEWLGPAKDTASFALPYSAIQTAVNVTIKKYEHYHEKS